MSGCVNTRAAKSIILFYGPSGTGKTTTANAIAQAMGRSLLHLVIGSVAGSLQEFTTAITSYFKMAQDWGCVLLLSKIEYMLRGNDSDNESNFRLDILLRAIDQYTGVLLLEVNRQFGEHDTLLTRVHLRVYFPTTTRETATALWMSILKRSESENQDLRFDVPDIMRFGEGEEEISDMNGRQMENLFATAIQFARFKPEESNRDFGLKVPPCVSATSFKDVAVLKESAVKGDYTTLELMETRAREAERGTAGALSQHSDNQESMQLLQEGKDFENIVTIDT
jgi:SpoVK/Ycf46/Vps4 family AAA+-type ATPase